MSLPCIHRRGAVAAAQEVDSGSDGIKVVESNTASIGAQVVNPETIGNRAVVHFVDDSVGHSVAPFAIAIVVDWTGPVEAAN